MKNPIIRTIYLYLFSAIGLIMLFTGTARIVDVGLREWVFTNANSQEIRYPIDEKEIMIEPNRSAKQQRDRDLAGAVSWMLVGLPLFTYHWREIKKDKKV